MKIYLMTDPWASSPEAMVEADNLRQWRQGIAGIAPLCSGRAYAVAVEMLDRDPSGKPFPVQIMGPGCREVADPANFLAVRTGMIPERIAAIQWAAITALPAYYREWDKFFSGFRDLFREATHPPPRLVMEQPRDSGEQV